MRRSLATLGFAAVVVLLVTTALSWHPASAARKTAGQERVEAAKATFDAVKAAFGAGTAPLDSVYLWSLRWMSSQQEAGVAKTTALADHLTRMKDLETTVKARVQTGTLSRTDQLAARYYCAEAELWTTRK
jgi:hypothetical protein